MTGRRDRRAAALALAGLLSGAWGCRLELPFLSFRGGQDALLIGLVARQDVAPGENPLELLNPLGPYEALRDAMQQELGRPVRLDLCLRPLLEPCLRDGHYGVAILSPYEYALLPGPERFEIIAVSTDAAARPARSALLVVAATSTAQTIADLRGRKIAFGLQRDARAHAAGLELLGEHGLSRGDLSLEVLPLPGSLRTFPKPRDVMQAVVNGSYDAGFVDEASWESLPAGGDSLTRGRMRVLGRTAALPDLIVLASPKLDAAQRERLSQTLLALGHKRPDALRPLNIAGFAAIPADVRAACLRLHQSPAVAPATAPAGEPPAQGS